MTQNLQLGPGHVYCRAAGLGEECSLLSGSSSSHAAQQQLELSRGRSPCAHGQTGLQTCAGAQAWLGLLGLVGQVDRGHPHTGTV